MKKLMSAGPRTRYDSEFAACGGKTTGTSPDSSGDSQQETPATSDGAFPEKQVTIIMPWTLAADPIPLPARLPPMVRSIWVCP